MHINQQVSDYNAGHCLLNPSAQVIDFHARLTVFLLYKEIWYALPINLQFAAYKSESVNLNRCEHWLHCRPDDILSILPWWHFINIVTWSSYIHVVFIVHEAERHKHHCNCNCSTFILQLYIYLIFISDVENFKAINPSSKARIKFLCWKISSTHVYALHWKLSYTCHILKAPVCDVRLDFAHVVSLCCEQAWWSIASMPCILQWRNTKRSLPTLDYLTRLLL